VRRGGGKTKEANRIRKTLTLVAIVLALYVLLIPLRISQAAQIEVCFAPRLLQGCDPTESIVGAVNRAHKQVLVQAYEFTSAAIAKSVVDAQKRGLDVRVILDKSNLHEGYSAATFFQHESVQLLIDSMHAIAHNKIMVLDGETVITGSFNFTKSAETRNAENLLIIHDPVLAARYLQNWNVHAAHSTAIGAARTKLPKTLRSSHIEEGNHADRQVIGNRRSHIYAWPGCGSYDKMSPANRVEFRSREAAEQAGYRAAKNCL
jgi:phosphatidylserine/phosphatidylglycerophosphate/cardiolipin synthase-like enzyme